MRVIVSQSVLAEAKALAEGGDLSINERITTYRHITGDECPLSGDALLVACMTEDADDDEFVTRVNNIRDHGFEVHPDTPNAAE